jgi:(p)ppGpp synthase/HD superfamily hydrolase
MTQLERSKFSPSQRFTLALDLATALHGGQRRKTGDPYIAHLLEVCACVLQARGDEDQAIAALLHDGPEKSGGRTTLLTIQNLFGDRVMRMVEDCSDSFDGEDKAGWKARKQAQLERFRTIALPESCLVYAGDKLSITREISRRLRREGPVAWTRYRGGREGYLKYLRTMYDAFLKRAGTNPLMEELDKALTDLERSPSEAK